MARHEAALAFLARHATLKTSAVSATTSTPTPPLHPCPVPHPQGAGWPTSIQGTAPNLALWVCDQDGIFSYFCKYRLGSGTTLASLKPEMQ